MRTLGLAVALAAVTALPSMARDFVYTYNGHLPADAIVAGTTLTTATPFEFRAVFDDTTTNLAAPIGVADFVAYAPVRATLSVAGHRLALKTWDGTSGVAVSIFGSGTPFGPGHVASGFIQNVLADGAGVVGDWLSSTPSPFDATGALQPFRMNAADFFGVGLNIGPCISACFTPAAVYATQPIAAWDSGTPTSVTLVTASLTYVGHPEGGAPFTPYRDSASLALPEPGALAMSSLGALTLMGVAQRRRR